MKKKLKKLSLSRETLRNLGEQDLVQAAGGGPTDPCTNQCSVECTCNCNTEYCDVCTQGC